MFKKTVLAALSAASLSPLFSAPAMAATPETLLPPVFNVRVETLVKIVGSACIAELCTMDDCVDAEDLIVCICDPHCRVAPATESALSRLG